MKEIIEMLEKIVKLGKEDYTPSIRGVEMKHLATVALTKLKAQEEAPLNDGLGKLSLSELDSIRNSREQRRKVGSYWLSPEGRAEIHETWQDPNDGNCVLPLLNALEAQEEADRYCVKVVIPELEFGYCGRCSMKYFAFDYKCILGYMNKLQKPTIQCPRYQK
jgi:hypothetical protein